MINWLAQWIMTLWWIEWLNDSTMNWMIQCSIESFHENRMIQWSIEWLNAELNSWQFCIVGERADGLHLPVLLLLPGELWVLSWWKYIYMFDVQYMQYNKIRYKFEVKIRTERSFYIWYSSVPLINCKHPQTISAEYSKAERADLNMLLQVRAQKFKQNWKFKTSSFLQNLENVKWRWRPIAWERRCRPQSWPGNPLPLPRTPFSLVTERPP